MWRKGMAWSRSGQLESERGVVVDEEGLEEAIVEG